MSEWREVGTALLGTWPSQVAGWGREAIAAYVAELRARGLTADHALVAIRSSESTFVPSAGELRHAARRDPSQPTFAEAFQLIFGPRGALRASVSRGGTQIYDRESDRQRAEHEAIVDRAAQFHPLIGAFIVRQGIRRLRMLPVDDPDWGEKHRRDLQAAWERHVEAFDGREVAALASGRPDDLHRLDPLAAIPRAPRQLEAQTS